MNSHYERLKLKKIIQTTAYLLSLNNCKMNYTKLLKLLYISDREALKNWDESITGDNYAVMKNGPILSKTYDLIMDKGQDFEQCEWNINFNVSNYYIFLKQKITYNELSQDEMNLLKEIRNKFKKYSYSKMITYVHDKNLFPETKDTGDSSIPITVEEILKAIGRSDNEIEKITSENKTYQKENEFLTNNYY